VGLVGSDRDVAGCSVSVLSLRLKKNMKILIKNRQSTDRVLNLELRYCETTSFCPPFVSEYDHSPGVKWRNSRDIRCICLVSIC
jgi:hypothetical protein